MKDSGIVDVTIPSHSNLERAAKKLVSITNSLVNKSINSELFEVLGLSQNSKKQSSQQFTFLDPPDETNYLQIISSVCEQVNDMKKERLQKSNLDLSKEVKCFRDKNDRLRKVEMEFNKFKYNSIRENLAVPATPALFTTSNVPSRKISRNEPENG